MKAGGAYGAFETIELRRKREQTTANHQRAKECAGATAKESSCGVVKRKAARNQHGRYLEDSRKRRACLTRLRDLGRRNPRFTGKALATLVLPHMPERDPHPDTEDRIEGRPIAAQWA